MQNNSDHLAGGDGGGVPVVWRRKESGLWIYYETKAWDDLEPLYATPAEQGDAKDAARVAALAEQAHWVGESIGGHWVIKLHNKRHTSFLQTVDDAIAKAQGSAA